MVFRMDFGDLVGSSELIVGNGRNRRCVLNVGCKV